MVNISSFKTDISSWLNNGSGTDTTLSGTVSKWFGNTSSTEALNGGLSKIMSGDLLGGGLAALKGLGGIINGNNHREQVAKKEIEKAFKTLESSKKDLAAINEFFAKMGSNWAYEKSQGNGMEKLHAAAIEPLKAELTKEGFVSESKSAVHSRGNTPYQYLVWSAPANVVQSFMNGAAGVTGAISGVTVAVVGGLGYVFYKMFSKKK